MTLPRRVLPERTWLLTRVCTDRRFLLRPSRTIRNIEGYMMAVIAERHDVAVHALSFLSDHYHGVVSCTEAVLSDFLRDLNAFTARAINAHIGRWENLWSSAKPSACELVDADATFEGIQYVVLNTVEAGLVANPKEWEGLRSLPRDYVQSPRTFTRPAKFCRPEQWPDKARLTIVLPPHFADEDPHHFCDRLATTVNARASQLEADRKAAGRPAIGMRAAKKVSRFSTARSPRVMRKLNPAIKSKDRERRKEAIRELQEFRRAHREARTAWLADPEEPVVFPAGTVAMASYPGVRVEPAKPT